MGQFNQEWVDNLASLVKRLDELASLEKGWLDGEGEPVAKEVLKKVETVVFDLLDRGIARPAIFPTESGGVQVELVHNDWDVDARFEQGEEAIEFSAIHLYDEEEHHVWFGAEFKDDIAEWLLSLKRKSPNFKGQHAAWTCRWANRDTAEILMRRGCDMTKERNFLFATELGEKRLLVAESVLEKIAKGATDPQTLAKDALNRISRWRSIDDT